MEDGCRKTMCRGLGEGADRISSLPSNVAEHILSFLTLREAVKTSLLSTEWRNHWKYLPTLVFDNTFSKPRANPYEMLLDVFSALMLRRGPVRELSLSNSQFKGFPDKIDQLLHVLDRTHIESLFIDIKDYILPPCVFSFGKLRKLHLCSCRCTSSVIAFDSFALLTVLELRAVTLLNGVQVSFSFNCPLLSDLTMDGCGDHTNMISIVIEAPSLHSFRIVGSFGLLDFKHTPILKRVSVHQRLSFVEANGEKPSNFLKIMNGLPALEHLSVSGLFCKFLNVGNLSGPTVMQSTHTRLARLILNEMCFKSRSQIWSAISLLNISLHLEELILSMKMQVESTPETIVRCSRLLSQCRVVHHQLKRVKVNQLHGTVPETVFIRQLLDTSPKLEKVEIEFAADLRVDEQMSILKELIKLPRASPTARIEVN